MSHQGIPQTSSYCNVAFCPARRTRCNMRKLSRASLKVASQSVCKSCHFRIPNAPVPFSTMCCSQASLTFYQECWEVQTLLASKQGHAFTWEYSQVAPLSCFMCGKFTVVTLHTHTLGSIVEAPSRSVLCLLYPVHTNGLSSSASKGAMS
eukprot:3670470-Amphidinium_carterae.1